MNILLLTVLAVTSPFIILGIAYVITWIFAPDLIPNEAKMYKELCQDSQFYYGDNHAEKCYQYGVKPK